MKYFIILLLGINAASAVTHSLNYFYTGSTGIEAFPQFVAVGIVDGMQIDYFDSVSEKNVLKQSWMEGVRDEKMITDVRKNYQQTFKVNVENAMQRFNQSTGYHYIQYIYGCSWDDETGVTEGFRQLGYDGEDFLVYDMKTLTWIAPKQQAEISQHKWNSNQAGLVYSKNYISQTCIEWLKKYLDYGKSTLQRTVHPSMSLLQKTPSSPVTCHATGFYPSGVMVIWQKDGHDQHEDVETGETLHNDDGTFQKSVHLTVTPEEWKNNKYQCVVQVTGINEDFIKVLTESEIQTNRGKTNRALIIGVAVALLDVVAVVVGVVIWKKKNKNKKGFLPTSTSDTDSDNSGKGVQKT